MKHYKILTAAMAAAVLSGASAMAQFNYQNGDLLAAFGNGSAPDVVVDLGSIANFQNGIPNSWNLNAVLTSTFGSVNSSLYWAVFGVNDTTITPNNGAVTQASPYTVWSSLARTDPGTQNDTPTVSGDASSQHQALNNIKTIAGLTTPSAAPGQITDYAPGIEQVASSLGGGFTSEMDGGSGDLDGTWSFDLLNNGAGVSDFYQNDPGGPFAPATYLGNFSLDSSGNLDFNPVPEPTTFAMIGSGAMALLALRRRK